MGGAGAFPHRVRNGVAYLQSQGFEVELSRHALEQHGHVSDTAEKRAADLHEMFERSDVAAMEPNVELDITGGVFYPNDCHLSPDKFLSELKVKLKKDGVIFKNTEVTRIESGNNRITGISTGDEKICAPSYQNLAKITEIRGQQPSFVCCNHSETRAKNECQFQSHLV